jgi:hypothetical protein
MLAAGWLTSKKLCGMLGISRTTLGKRRRDGLVDGRICSDNGEWLYRPPDTTPKELPLPSSDQQVTSTAKGAV